MRHDEATFTTDDGLSIFHQAWLPDGEARAVVLLFHGLGEHSGRYDHVATRLVSSGYAVHALDHRGHGRSGGKRAFVKSYDELQRDLLQFRQIVVPRHPRQPLIVMGHSMGGNLALGHVLDHQPGVAALVLSGPAIKIGDDFSAIEIKLIGVLGKLVPGLRPRALSADAISRDPAVVAAYRSDPLVFTGKVSAGLGAALMAAMQSFADRYPELRLPILVQHGTQDQLTNVEGSRELERLAVNADVTAHYYDGLYHEVYNEPERDTVLADLVGWLDRVTATAAGSDN